MSSVMDNAAEKIQRKRAESGIFRRSLELDRALRAATEEDLRELVRTGAIEELLDEPMVESELEY